MPSLFGGYLTPTLVFALLGLVTIVWARQTTVSLAWIGGFIALAFVRSAITGMNVVVALAPALGPAFLLFSFHMISDPSTTPRTRNQRIAFGLAVALIDASVRLLRIPYGSFYALFLVCVFNPWLRDREAPAVARLSTAKPQES
jgi:Na+-translocating ferredoxin:NAD+ oxidoreductase RnfD subunit